MTAPTPDLVERVARWLCDSNPTTDVGAPFWDECGPDRQARYRLAAVDLLNGPLAAALCPELLT